jgi:hypothetical protein
MEALLLKFGCHASHTLANVQLLVQRVDRGDGGACKGWARGSRVLGARVKGVCSGLGRPSYLGIYIAHDVWNLAMASLRHPQPPRTDLATFNRPLASKPPPPP